LHPASGTGCTSPPTVLTSAATGAHLHPTVHEPSPEPPSATAPGARHALPAAWRLSCEPSGDSSPPWQPLATHLQPGSSSPRHPLRALDQGGRRCAPRGRSPGRTPVACTAHTPWLAARLLALRTALSAETIGAAALVRQCDQPPYARLPRRRAAPLPHCRNRRACTHRKPRPDGPHRPRSPSCAQARLALKLPGGRSPARHHEGRPCTVHLRPDPAVASGVTSTEGAASPQTATSCAASLPNFRASSG